MGYYTISISNKDYTCNALSVALSYNRQTYRGLYVGAGLQPLYCYPRPLWVTGSRFDMPLFVKAGYDFGGVDISVCYKKGLTEMLKDKNVKDGKINDLQVQMFIAF